MIISNTVSKLAPSATLQMSKKAKFLENQGYKVFDFSVGEPDLFPPDVLFSEALNAIKSKAHTYTPVSGTLPLKDSILKYTEKYQNLSGWTARQVCVSTGAKQVIYNALMASLETSDEVIIPSPYWVSYPAIVELAKARQVFVPCEAHNDFKLTSDQLERAITHKTKWLILNSPNNPTGTVYDTQTLYELAMILMKFPSVFILSDDIYESLSYTHVLCPHLLHVCPELQSRMLVVNGISKSLAATGWRLGWGIGPDSLIEAMEKIQSHSTSGSCCLVQKSVEHALNTIEIESYLNKNRQIFSSRRDVLMKALKRLPGGEALKCPEGAFYVFYPCLELLAHPKICGLGWKTDTELAEGMLQYMQVCTVPGSEFGKSGYLRFSYAVSIDVIKEGVAQIENFLKIC
ncbi:aspartate aminotransferase A [Holospora obtusa F1]|uniref:Aminotransferase n=1 Tax=Holospora obtusa F1 TaxID=1399147 RepID=W6TGP2_HOLOB|nr:pyridoxal phosphate-dependent aminotransferase [Holospora obtusa]ETZ07090.1 aspartate aminotransferase A [Holospora obtusa F1]